MKKCLLPNKNNLTAKNCNRVAIISKEKPSGLDVLITIYPTFQALREITNAVTGKFYWLLNNDFNLVYFLSSDTTSPDSAPNTLVTVNNQRLKLIGSE